MSIQQSTFNVLFIIKRTRLLKNGEAPIAMRITVKGQMGEILIKRSVPVSLWDQKKECSKGKDYTAKELNHFIETTRTRIFQIRRQLEDTGKLVCLDTVRDCYYGRDTDTLVKQLTLCSIYQEHNDKCRALIGIDFTKSTVEKFDTSLKALKEYISHSYKKSDLPLSEINGQFIRGLEFYLKTVRNCQHNSAIKHLKNLKKIIRIALVNDWISKDPFKGIVFKHDKTTKEYLTEEELYKLYAKEFISERLEHVRDIFLFGCFTGLAFIDIKNLKKEDISTGRNGEKWIYKDRQKTGQESRIQLIEPALEIIKKYESNPYCTKNNVLLPVLSNQKMNEYLKEIATLCGITKNLSTHIARYTCATVVLLESNVGIHIAKKILGHANVKMTEHYAKTLDSSISNDMKKVEERFSKYKFS